MSHSVWKSLEKSHFSTFICATFLTLLNFLGHSFIQTKIISSNKNQSKINWKIEKLNEKKNVLFFLKNSDWDIFGDL